MKRYLKILGLFARFNLMRQLSYRPSFVLALVGKIVRIGILLLFFKFLYLRTSLLAHWTHEQTLVLIAIYLTIEFAFSVTYHRNLLYFFPADLHKGAFDFALTRPILPLFHASFRVVDFFDLFSTIPVAGLWVYIIATQKVMWGVIPLVAFFIAMSLTLMYAITLLLATTSFWTIRSSGLGRMTEHIMRVGRFPADVFHGGWRIFFWYVVPVAALATLPAKVWFLVFDPFYTVYAIFITIVLLFAAFRFWQFGLRHYQSASS